MKDRKMNLQLFAEEQMAAETADNPPATDTAEASNADAEGAHQVATGEAAEESFEELIKTRYKDDFDKKVQEIVKKRVKNSKQAEERMNKMNPVLELFGKRYGIDTANMTDEVLEQLTGQILEDNSFYEEEAIERGMDVEALKAIQRTERENAALRKFKEDTERNMETHRRFMGLRSQAEEVKKVYPGFDLDTEMSNPDFQRLAWGAGVPLQTAYEVIHHNEILPAAMQYTAQRTAEKISNSIQSGMNRPQENGLSEQSASLSEGTSPRNWSKEEREALKQRVRSGEKVVL